MLLPNLTLLSCLNKDQITLRGGKIHLLDRFLDIPFKIYKSDSSFLSGELYQEFSIETVKFQLNSACFGVFNNTPAESFYKNIYNIQQYQNSIYSKSFWLADFCFKIEGVKLSFPILEHPNYILCITDKEPKETLIKCKLTEINTDSFLMELENRKL